MIVAVYGIPRCGKDTFIGEVLNKKPNSLHIKGSQKLNDLSIEHFDRKFKELDDAQQNAIRILFAKYADGLKTKFDLVIVDGHYSVPDGNSFKKVFTDEDLLLYDAFFYLNRTPDEISRNYRNGDKKEYENLLLSSDKVKEWIEYEISHMKKEVEGAEKDFIVLDSDPFAVDYVCSFNQTTKETAFRIVKEIRSIAGDKNIVLTDLDKTVSINDLTYDFIRNSGLDPLLPKIVFKDDYYTDYQFASFHRYLMKSSNFDESIDYSLEKLILNNDLINDLRNLKKESVIIAITTGMVDAWSKKNQKLMVLDKIYGFSKEQHLVVSPFLKMLIARYLSKTNKTIAIGDSIIDIGMLLESNKGYLVSMAKLDKRIVNCFNSKEIEANILQPPYSTFKYDFLKEDTLKW